MHLWIKLWLLLLPFCLEAIPFYFWEPDNGTHNFGDYVSLLIVQKILGRPVPKADIEEHKMLACGSILHFARDGDVIWGSGINGKHPLLEDYKFHDLDVRSVRGPLTRLFLKSLGITAPPVYGDPGLLFAHLFPEFQKNPIREYVVVIHSSEEQRIPRHENVIYSTDPWKKIVRKITESKLVISTSLHGLVIAESFGIPARLLRLTQNEPLFKYADYYLGTGRQEFQYATTIKQALKMGGEAPPVFDLDQILKAFPIELFEEGL